MLSIFPKVDLTLRFGILRFTQLHFFLQPVIPERGRVTKSSSQGTEGMKGSRLRLEESNSENERASSRIGQPNDNSNTPCLCNKQPYNPRKGIKRPSIPSAQSQSIDSNKRRIQVSGSPSFQKYTSSLLQRLNGIPLHHIACIRFEGNKHQKHATPKLLFSETFPRYIYPSACYLLIRSLSTPTTIVTGIEIFDFHSPLLPKISLSLYFEPCPTTLHRICRQHARPMI